MKISTCKFALEMLVVIVILDSPYYVFVALCIVVIVVSLIFKMAYFLSCPVQELLKKLGSGAHSQQQNIRENIQFHTDPLFKDNQIFKFKYLFLQSGEIHVFIHK